MPIFVFLVFICLIFPCYAQQAVVTAEEEETKVELPSLKPDNQHSFDNFIKVIKQLETESFLKGQSIFSLKTVTPREIILDYKKDTTTADKLYKGRFIRIKAVVVDIRKDAFNKYYFETHGNDSKDRVIIYFDPQDSRYVQYKAGDSIDLACYGQGIKIAFPQFGQCMFATDYINKEYNAIEQHIALATQANYQPISKKELSTIILYKSIEPKIKDACKKSVQDCLNQTLTELKNEPNSEAAAKYAPINEKYANLPNLPPKDDSL